MKYEYKATYPYSCRDERQIEKWLNELDEQGWEFVGYGVRHWHDADDNRYWIFRRPRENIKKKGNKK